MNIAVLGGSFNPPHIGHFLVAKQVLEEKNLDEVWLMPVFEHPFNKSLEKADSRFQMVKSMEDENIKASDFEIKLNKINYTIDTLKSLSQMYTNVHFSLIIGSDQLDTLDKWKSFDELIEKYKVYVFPRHNENDKTMDFYKDKIKKVLGQIHPNFEILSNENLIQSNISSSEIRERIKNDECIRYLVDPNVDEFIKTNSLYK